MRRFLVVAGLVIVANAMGQVDPQRDFVVSGKNVYMMLPPEFICGPNIREVSWSVDGDKVAIVRNFMDISPSVYSDMLLGAREDRDPPEIESQIITWSSVTRKTTTVYRLKQSQGEIESVQWLAGSSSLLVDVKLLEAGDPGAGNTVGRRDLSEVPSTAFLLSPGGKVIQVFHDPDARGYTLNPSPTKPLVLLTEYPATPTLQPRIEPATPPELPTMRFFGTDGILSPPMKMPGPHTIPFWSSNGQLYVLMVTRKPDEKTARRDWFLVDRANQRCQHCPPPADQASMFQRNEPQELQIENLNSDLAEGKFHINAPTIVISAKQAKDEELSVVSTDGKEGELSPKLNAVSFVSQGSFMIRPMIKVPIDAYLRAKAAALRAKLINQAKQVALALLMNANDNNDNLVTKDTNLTNALGPYLKDNSLLGGFNYVYGGVNMSSIEQPATTIMGYFDGPGGRAVAYCDGHVKWIPNP